jgi:hypothetical protein
VAFSANLNNSSASSGIFAGSIGSLQTVALRGSNAPGAGTYSDLQGIGRNPVLNDAGQVASMPLCQIARPLKPFLPMSVQAVAKVGMPTTTGGTFSGFRSPVLNGAGQIAVRAFINGGSTAGGIFLGGQGSLQPIGLSGMAARAGGNSMSLLRFRGSTIRDSSYSFPHSAAHLPT